MLDRSISTLRYTVSAAALLTLAFVPAHAQQTQQDQTQQTQQQSQQQNQQTQQGNQQTQQGSQQTQQGNQQSQQGGQQATGQGTETPSGGESGGAADSLVATVGEEEVRASDVLAVIDMMPPRLRQQPQEMLVPMAVEQLILRELILQQALSENLREDAEVIALVEENARVAEEDAMVNVWLRREMENRITDERVQEIYDRLQSESEQELPPLEQVRPQIEQQLGREAIQGIRSELGDNISVVYYGPDGQPRETTAEAEPGTAPAGQGGTSGTAGAGTAGTTAGMGDTGAGAGANDAGTTGTGPGAGGATGAGGSEATGGAGDGSGGSDGGQGADGATAD